MTLFNITTETRITTKLAPSPFVVRRQQQREAAASGGEGGKLFFKRSRSCSRPGLQKVAICAACWPATAAM
ncbi:MAG: hypothetical protein MRY72_05590 [Aquisalinus sp.]|nr:hypothetical protein [Aquisalinus sp.]